MLPYLDYLAYLAVALLARRLYVEYRERAPHTFKGKGGSWLQD